MNCAAAVGLFRAKIFRDRAGVPSVTPARASHHEPDVLRTAPIGYPPEMSETRSDGRLKAGREIVERVPYQRIEVLPKLQRAEPKRRRDDARIQPDVRGRLIANLSLVEQRVPVPAGQAAGIGSHYDVHSLAHAERRREIEEDERIVGFRR
jgi:hypothetical protein